MNTPAPQLIAEVIDKLSSLQDELRRIQNTANYGEDPEAAALAAKKAEGFFRCLLQNPPADRKRTTQELEDLKAHLASKGIQLPSHLDMYLAVLEGISGVLRALPTHHLEVLKSRIALETVSRDDEEIAAGFTIGGLKDTIALLVKTNEYTMSTAMQNARARVYREAEEILHPYEEFLTADHQDADKRRVSLTGSILSADVEQLDWVIHAFKKIKRKLEVEGESDHRSGWRSWLWTLYEKTIKALFDAILDRVNKS